MRGNSIKSHCKLNLFLDVGKRQKNTKLHNIQSLVYLLNLHDEIKIKRVYKKSDVINFFGDFAKHVKKNNNSILRSFSLLRKKGFIKPGVHYQVSIKKKVPAFSGLGGGSSNSASIIKFILNKKKLNQKNLNYFSKLIGSDLKLFFYSNKIFQKNLNSFSAIKSKNRFHFVIVYPFKKCSTKEIYSKVNSFKIINKNYNYKYRSKIKEVEYLKLKKNSLEKIVMKKFPSIEKVLIELQRISSCQFSRLTGSGSACFGLFLSEKSAELGLKKIKKKFPNYWCVTGKTI